MNLRFARHEDIAFLLEREHLSQEKVGQKINQQEIILASIDNTSIGFLRYSFFWDSIPFMNLLWLDEPYRKQGFGTALVQFWEKQMHEQGFHQVMTSTQSNENAQHFYRKLGYKDCGALLLPEEALELLLFKELF